MCGRNIAEVQPRVRIQPHQELLQNATVPVHEKGTIDALYIPAITSFKGFCNDSFVGNIGEQIQCCLA